MKRGDSDRQAGEVAPSHAGSPIGRVLGTDDATPLSFWVALAPEQYLQLDDVVTLGTALARRPKG